MNKHKLKVLTLISVQLVEVAVLYRLSVHSLGLAEVVDKTTTEMEVSQEQVRQLSTETQGLSSTVDNLNMELDRMMEENQKYEKNIEELTEINNKLQQRIYDMNKKVSFNSQDVTKTSNTTEYHLKKMFLGTSLQGMGLEPIIIQAEQKYGINAIFLASLIANESSWGTSRRATEDDNLTGYAVYNRNSRGGEFSSKEHNIMATAELLAVDYVNPKGKHYNGTGVYDINVKYCQDNKQPNYSWGNTINSIATKLVKKCNNQ